MYTAKDVSAERTTHQDQQDIYLFTHDRIKHNNDKPTRIHLKPTQYTNTMGSKSHAWFSFNPLIVMLIICI